MKICEQLLLQFLLLTVNIFSQGPVSALNSIFLFQRPSSNSYPQGAQWQAPLLSEEKKSQPKQSLVATRYYSLSLVVVLVVIRCHSLSFTVPLATICCHSLSIVVPLVAIRFHSLSFVVIRCTTRCRSLSLVVFRCHSIYHSFVVLYTI